MGVLYTRDFVHWGFCPRGFIHKIFVHVVFVRRVFSTGVLSTEGFVHYGFCLLEFLFLGLCTLWVLFIESFVHQGSYHCGFFH